MSHARSLRVIGQTLEAARVATFELEKYGPEYMLWSTTVPEAGECLIRNALRHKVVEKDARSSAIRVFCFSVGDILRLDAQAQKLRRNQSFSGTPAANLVSHGLRTLGDHFDQMHVDAFRVEWTMRAVSIGFQRAGGKHHWKTLTVEEIRSLCEQAKTRRADPYLFLKLEI